MQVGSVRSGSPFLIRGALLGACALLVGPLVLSAPAAANVTAEQWHLDALDIDEVHEISTGEGITVGIIDTGVDVTHPDLEGANIRGAGFGWAQEDGLEDNHGHGTNVASMIVGQGVGTDSEDGVQGISPGVELLTASLPSPDEMNRLTEWREWVDEAMEWLVDEGADVINVSVSRASGDTYQYARDNGVQVIYAAGNTEEDEWGNLIDDYAQGQRGSIVVNAGDRNQEPSEYAVEFLTNHFGFTAPGVDIPVATLDGGYEMAEGASLAAPMTAGMWALVMSAYPDLTEEQLYDRMIWDKYPGSEPGELPEGRGGYGPIDPLKALTMEIEGQEMTGPPTDAEDPDDDGDSGNGDAGSEEPGDLTSGGTDTSNVPFYLGLAAIIAAVVAWLSIWLVKRKRSKPAGFTAG